MTKVMGNKAVPSEDLDDLKRRLDEAEQTLEAIRSGQVDAIAVYNNGAPQIFTLQGADAAYRVMVENMNEGALTLDHEGTILYVNLRLAAVLGIPAPAIIGKNIRELIPADEHRPVAAFLNKSFSGKNLHQDFTFIGISGNAVPVYLSGALLEFDTRPYLCVIATDLTERRIAEMRLTRLNEDLEAKVQSRTKDLLRQNENLERLTFDLFSSEQRFKDLADAMPQLVWTANANGVINYCNRRFNEYRGINLDENKIWTWEKSVHPDDLQLTRRLWIECLQSGDPFQIEHRLRRADGKYEWHLTRAVPVRPAHDQTLKWYGTTTNIHSTRIVREQLEASENNLRLLNENLEDLVVQRTQQVRDLSKALTVAEHRERVRFSQVLHDNLQQMLLSAKMQLDIVSESPASDAQSAADINAIRNVLARAITTTRSLALELNPPILSNEGLDAALTWLAHHMEKAYGLKIDLDIQPELALVGETERVLIIQLVRELLLNVFKHAHTKIVSIIGKCDGPNLCVAVEDRGVGFDPVRLSTIAINDRSMGIFSINERLRLFGGKLEIESLPGHGTRAAIVLPVDGKRGNN